jgi:hypothetical protein
MMRRIMRLARKRSRLWAIAALTSLGSVAFAGEPSLPGVGRDVFPSERPTDPEALIRRGLDLRRQGRSEEALPLFQAAYAAARTPRTAGQLALSEMSVGYWVLGETHLMEALEFPTHPWVARNEVMLREMLAKARQHIAEIVIAGSPPGAEVRVNGHLAGGLPLAEPLRFAEGRIEIRVTAAGYKSESRTLSLNGGEKQQLAVNLIQSVESARSSPTPSGERAARPLPSPTDVPIVASSGGAAPEEGPRWRTIAVAGASVLALGFSAVELYLWRHAQDSFDDHLGPPPGASAGATTARGHDCGEQDPMRGGQGCQSLYDQAVRARALSIVGVAAGAALGIISIVLWRSDIGHIARERRISCAVNPVSPGVGCQWRF